MENSQALSVREIGVITAEIKNICRQAQSMALLYAVEIGQRLVEAKQALPHGEWGSWLKNEVDFSQRSANNFMKIFEEYSGEVANSQALANLSYTKALELLAVPREERESFVEENRVDELSSRQLKEVIEERDRLLKEVSHVKKEEERLSQELASKEIALASASRRIEDSEQLRADLAKVTEDRDKKKKDIKKLKEDLKAAKENPEIPQEVLERMRAEFEAAMKAEAENASDKAMEDLQKRLDEAERRVKEANEAEQTAHEELVRLQGEVRFANPKMAEFKILFESVQKDVARLMIVCEEISADEPEVGKKLRMALVTFADSFSAG